MTEREGREGETELTGAVQNFTTKCFWFIIGLQLMIRLISDNWHLDNKMSKSKIKCPS